MNTDTLVITLRVDAATNAAAGLGLVVAGGWLAPHLGIPAGWPLRLAGLVLLAYAVENALVARRPTRTALLGLAGVDMGFVVAVLGAALFDPTGAAAPARLALCAIALASLGFGAFKLRASRHPTATRGARPAPSAVSGPGPSM
jgi:hypothetical protein